MTNMYEMCSRVQEYYLSFVRLVSQSLLSISLVMHWLGSDLDPGKALLSGQSGRRICIFLHTRHFGNLIKRFWLSSNFFIVFSCVSREPKFVFRNIYLHLYLVFVSRLRPMSSNDKNLMTKILGLLKNVPGLNLKVNLSFSRGLRQNLICSRLKLSKCAIAIPQAAHLLLNLWHFVNLMHPNFPR